MPDDRFNSYAASLNAPAFTATAITPSDSTDLGFTCRAVYVGTAGNLAVRMKGSATTVTFVNCAAGSILPLRLDRVLATGTTASSLIALD